MLRGSVVVGGTNKFIGGQSLSEGGKMGRSKSTRHMGGTRESCAKRKAPPKTPHKKKKKKKKTETKKKKHKKKKKKKQKGK